jgi:hypothetical protein
MAALIKRCYDPGEDASDLLGDVERVTELLNSSDRQESVARSTEKVVNDAGGINVFPVAAKQSRHPHSICSYRRHPERSEFAAKNGKTVLFITLE